jgi:hypothetical protein
VLNAFGRFTIGRRRSLQERFERHPNDIRGPAAQTARGSPERTTELGGQSDGDLIFHERLPLRTAIVVQRIAKGKKVGPVISLSRTCGVHRQRCTRVRPSAGRGPSSGSQRPKLWIVPGGGRPHIAEQGRLLEPNVKFTLARRGPLGHSQLTVRSVSLSLEFTCQPRSREAPVSHDGLGGHS